ncbi:MAG: HDOD domain-containing protein [Rubrivivax sp.]|nr:HDOD domain-containing protein [Rubrivivax sp.]
MGWLSRLLGGQDRSGAKPARAASARSGPAAGAAPEPAQTPSAPDAAAALGPPLLCWLLARPPAPPLAPVPGPLQPAEQQALALLDEVLAQVALPSELLPRSANVLPQLLAMLRQQDLPVPVLAERIGRDPVLAAEVLRQAGGAFFSHLGPVADLPQAIQRLGIEGLQMAIARVVLRPMFQAQPGSLSARTADRLWEHADVLSRHAVAAARTAGASAFDAYLAGLLHDSGWTVLMHALQRGGVHDLGTPSEEGAEAFAQRAHRLFGRAASPWQITPAFAAIAEDAQQVPLAGSAHPLAAVLRAAQPPCMAELLGVRALA